MENGITKRRVRVQDKKARVLLFKMDEIASLILSPDFLSTKTLFDATF